MKITYFLKKIFNISLGFPESKELFAALTTAAAAAAAANSSCLVLCIICYLIG